MAAKVRVDETGQGWHGDEEGWGVAQGEEAWDAWTERLGRCFRRVEVRERALSYSKGLLSPSIERKNGWQLAEAMGEVQPDGVQYLLNRAKWRSDEVRDAVRADVVERLGTAQGILVVDETGVLKKGRHSAGVQRQYTGTAGKVENCQIGVFLAYTRERGHALIDRALDVPKAWAEDATRCQAAGIPEAIGFATKPQLAQRMLERAFEAGIRVRWVTADEGYGSHRALRQWLEGGHQAYVLTVACSETVGWQGQAVSAKEVVGRLWPGQWERGSAGAGSQGPRRYEWAWVALEEPTPPGWQRALLLRRALKDPAEVAYYRVFAPQPTDWQEWVAVAGSRWTVETSFEDAKGEVGLDHYEVRSREGWYRHITLAMAALAFLAAVHARVQADGAQKKIPLLRPCSLP